MKTLLVGLAGFAGAGKNAIADAMGFSQASFATELKNDLKPLLKKLGLDMNNYQDKAKARNVLVEWGRLARSIDPAYWVKQLVLPEDSVVVITDVRYLNEANFIVGNGGLVVYIDRPGVKAANAEERDSMNALVNGTFHLPIIVNDTTVKAAADKVLAAMIGFMDVEKYAKKTAAIDYSKFFDHHAIDSGIVGKFKARPGLNPIFDHVIVRDVGAGIYAADAVMRDGKVLKDHWTVSQSEEIKGFIQAGRWVPVDLDACGTCDGIQPLASCIHCKKELLSPPCTNCGIEWNPNKGLITDPAAYQYVKRDPVAEFDNAMVSQDADRIHAQATQQRFTDLSLQAKDSDLDTQEAKTLWASIKEWWVNN